MIFYDFHTHLTLPKNVEGIFSSTAETEGKFLSRQCLPGEWTGCKIELENIVALGEVGLDRRLDLPMARQMEIFDELLEYAPKKPVIIHCVRAYPELNAVLKNHGERKVLLHRFSGSTQELEKQTAAGRMISQSIKELQTKPEVAKYFTAHPENLHLFALESDNDLVDYHELYAQASKLLKIHTEKLIELMRENFERFTGIK